MNVSASQLLAVMPNAKSRISIFLGPLNAAMSEFGITSKLEVASFLSQCGHESGQLLYTTELATGIAYEGRTDLGNTQPGDGRLFKGRGLIQITGRNNFTALMMALDIDCIVHPEVVAEPVNACRASAWWWSTNNCKKWALEGNNQAVSGIVNTGSPTRSADRINGLADRMALYKKAMEVLN